MEKMTEIQKKIEIARLELNRAALEEDDYESVYEKSVRLDKLIEEYLEEEEKNFV